MQPSSPRALITGCAAAYRVSFAEMIRRDRPRGHAAPTARARRIRAASARDQRLRAQGIDPDEWEHAAASAWGPPIGQDKADTSLMRTPASARARKPLRI